MITGAIKTRYENVYDSLAGHIFEYSSDASLVNPLEGRVRKNFGQRRSGHARRKPRPTRTPPVSQLRTFAVLGRRLNKLPKAPEK